MGRFEDRYGLPVTTASAEAFALFTDAQDRALATRAGARALLEQATTLDADFPLALALLGVQLRTEGDMKAGTVLVERAVARADSCTPREQGHLAMLDAYCHARFPEAQLIADDHLRRWPADATVMMQANFVFNLLSAELDRREKHHALAQRVLTHSPDDWYFLGEAAFAAAEVDCFDDARDYAHRSLAGNPHNGEAAHAAAHTHLETGTLADGRAWLQRWLQEWDAPSFFACHLAWHLALFAVADGRSADADYPDILRYTETSITALMDGASLLWRLRIDGFEPLPWAALAEIPSAPGYSLSNFHRGFVLAGVGDFDGLRAWAQRLRANVAKGHPSAAVCAEVVEAVGHHAQGDFAAAAQRLEAAEPEWSRLGGSRAQLSVLDDTLIDALARAGRAGDAVGRLDARLARREVARDRTWRARLAGER